MNPMTNVKNITKLNEIELQRGTAKSWHDLYKDSAWIFIGGLSYGLTEGDVLCVFSQYGEIVNVNLVRDKKTGKTKGFCFLCYANQKSTVLAVDNLNGIKICGRTIRVDHVANYKPPKENDTEDDITKQLRLEGCAPKPIKIETNSEKKSKKEKKKKHKKKSSKKHSLQDVEVKKEKEDPGYAKYENLQKRTLNSKSGSEDSQSSSAESSDESKSLDNHPLNGKKRTMQDSSNSESPKRNKSDSSNSESPKRNKSDSYQSKSGNHGFSKSTHKSSKESNQRHRADDRNNYDKIPSTSKDRIVDHKRRRHDSSSSDSDSSFKHKSSNKATTCRENEKSSRRCEERLGRNNYQRSHSDRASQRNHESDEKYRRHKESYKSSSHKHRSEHKSHKHDR